MDHSLTDPLIFSDDDLESGGKDMRNSSGLQNDFAYHNNVHNASIKIRMGTCHKSLLIFLNIWTFPFPNAWIHTLI